MNEFARRYGGQESLLAGHEGAAINAMSRMFGGHGNLLAYLSRVQPSRNVETAPHVYYLPREPTLSDEEMDEVLREEVDRENTSPLYRPEADNFQSLRSWMVDLFNKRAPR